jgi:glycosyltransferase involved in cell wall biosynthesis
MSPPFSELETLAFSPPPMPPAPLVVPSTAVPIGLGPIAGDTPPTLRVLHLVNGEHYSGAERVQDLLARQLPRMGCEVGFVCVKPRRFPTARESKSTPLVEMPMHGRFDVRLARQIARLVEDDAYDLIHTHTPRTALLGRFAARRARVPHIYHVHSPAGRDSNRRWSNWANTLVEWACLRDADRLIAVSPSLRQYMIDRGFPAERIVHVANGVPICTQSPARHRRPVSPA